MCVLLTWPMIRHQENPEHWSRFHALLKTNASNIAHYVEFKDDFSKNMTKLSIDLIKLINEHVTEQHRWKSDQNLLFAHNLIALKVNRKVSLLGTK